jgi:cytochrome P450
MVLGCADCGDGESRTPDKGVPMSAASNTGTAERGCPAHHGFEPFHQHDPFPAYAALRVEEPVMYDERIGCWVVTRYDDVRAIFGDWETFSSENAQAPVREHGPAARQIMEEGGFTAYSGLSARVPPEHTRIRKVVAKAFTPRRYRALEPAVRADVVSHVERMLARDDRTGDLVADLAYHVPTTTIVTLVGADIARTDTFKRWSDSRSAMTWGDLSDDEQVPHACNLVEYWQECRRLVAEAHAEERDSLVGDLVRAQRSGDPITDHEIASVCYSLLFAGHETTTTLISNVLRMLLDHRDQWRRVVDDPAAIPGAVEEVLRLSPSIMTWRRRTTRDATVGAVAIPAGADLLLVMASANRDESRFPDPDTFDIARPNAREHLAFGYGIHYCVGAMLAKLQAVVAVEEVARRAPDLRLLDHDAIRFGDNLSFRAPVAVPVTWGA